MIKENTYVVNFWLGNLFAKEKFINQQRQKYKYCNSKRNNERSKHDERRRRRS